MKLQNHNSPFPLLLVLVAGLMAGAGAAVAAQPNARSGADGSAAQRPRVVQSPKLDDAGADNSCEAQWQRFNEAYACLEPYRIKEGRVRAEGFKHCPVLAQPDCPPPDTQ